MDRNAVAGSFIVVGEDGYDSGFDLWIICVVWIPGFKCRFCFLYIRNEKLLFRGQVFGLFIGGSKGAQRNLVVFIC